MHVDVSMYVHFYLYMNIKAWRKRGTKRASWV